MNTSRAHAPSPSTTPARMRRIVAGALVTGALATGGLLAGTGAASAGVTVKIHSAPSASAPAVGWTNADCYTIGHAPRVAGSGGYWYRIGTHGWIFNSGAYPFCQ